MTSSPGTSHSPEQVRGWQTASMLNHHAQWSDASASTASAGGQSSYALFETPGGSSGMRSMTSSSSAGSSRQPFVRIDGADNDGHGGDAAGQNVFVIGHNNALLSAGSNFNTPPASAPVTSPLFDCVNPTHVELPVTSRSSEAEFPHSRTANLQRPSLASLGLDKQLPSLPQNDDDENDHDDRFDAAESSTAHLSGSRYNETENEGLSGFQDRSASAQWQDPRSNSPHPSDTRTSSSQSHAIPTDMGTPTSFLRNRLSPFNAVQREKPAKQKTGRSWTASSKERTPNAKASHSNASDDPSLIGLGVQPVPGPSTNGAEYKDPNQAWTNRAAAVKAASQTAGMGLKKWGKASAAKLKQAQQMSREGLPLTSFKSGTGTGGGFKRYDNRAAKSATDLPMTSSDADSTPPMPSLPTATPDPRIGLPTDVRHNVHVDVGPRGYTGLPVSWAQVLAQYGMNAEDVRLNPEDAVELIRERTQYFVEQEAERGQDPEHTRRVLESRLGHLEDVEEAREAVRSATPGLKQARQSVDNSTRSDATATRLSIASTTYSSVLNQGWPASPRWSDAPSLPKLPISKQASPVLPLVEQDESEEDWGTSLLRALPTSSSTNSNLASRRRTMSFDEQKSVVQQNDRSDEAQTKDFDDADEAEDLNDDEEEIVEEYEEASIHTASRLSSISSLKITRSSHGLSSGDSDSALALRLMDRRESVNSTHSQSPSAISSSHRHEEASSDALRSSSLASRSGSSILDETGAVVSSPLSAQSLGNNTTHLSSIIDPNPPRPASSSSNATAASELSSQVAHSLRERRKNTPRIYPPSSSKFIPRDDAPSPHSIGFKPMSTNTHRVSNGSVSTRNSDGPYRTDRAPVESALNSATLSHVRGSTPDSAIKSNQSHDHGRNSGASVRLASTPLQVFLRQDAQVGEGSSDQTLSGSSLSRKGARRVSPAQDHSRDLISPESDGFFRSSSASSTSGLRSPVYESVSSRHNSSSLAQNDPPQPLSPVSVAQRPTSSQTQSDPVDADASTHRSASDDVDDEESDYQHASDFLDDWMNGDDESDGDGDHEAKEKTGEETTHAATPTDTTKKMQAQNQSHTPSFSSMQVPRFDSPSAHSIVPPNQIHQSPSPALLQGLPTPLRPNFGVQITPAPNPPPANVNFDSVTDQEHTSAPVVTEHPGWSLQPNDGKIGRDWRARSLPPPPMEEGGSVDILASNTDDSTQSGTANDRASIVSLPMYDEQQKPNGTGPPTADEEALEAAAMTRPSSRASRSSSRAGLRSLRRRSSDVRRFPLSMHFGDGDAATTDAEAATSFAELMRARQSMDLDDVLPLHMNPSSTETPPPLPLMPKIEQRQVEELSDGAGSDDAKGEDRDVFTQDELLPALQHLSPFLRKEDPRAVFGDLVLIGEGDSGNVFTALPSSACQIQSIKTRGKVAIKIVHLPSEGADGQASSGPSRFSKLDKELSLWRQAGNHENIVGLYEAFVLTEGAEQQHIGVWIAQEFMSISLADVIAMRMEGLQVTEAHMAQVVRDMCKGLRHLHSQSIVHRDVRSDNVLLTFDGMAKLSDFTHAASILEDKRHSVVGTAYWMAPEVIRAEGYDTRADIWSLGVVLYEMIEGNPPRVEFPALRAITLTTKLGLPALGAPNCWSASLKACLAWCTEMVAEQRPTADELLQSEFVASTGSHEQVADLIEAARTMEAESAASADEEVIDEDDHDVPHQSVRDSWTSQSTVHA